MKVIAYTLFIFLVLVAAYIVMRGKPHNDMLIVILIPSFIAGLIAAKITGPSVSSRPNTLVSQSSQPMATADLPPPSAEVLALVDQSQLIGAIKLYRHQTGAGLRDAKDIVERARAGRT